MDDYRFFLVEFSWCYENAYNRQQEKKAIKQEWRLRCLESDELQQDLHALEAPIPNITSRGLWRSGCSYEIRVAALNRIRVENNIMLIRRARYGMLRVCQHFATANRRILDPEEQESIIGMEEYLSNSDDE